MRNHEEIDKKFLFQENRQLRLELRETREVNKLHKEAIFQLSQPHLSANRVISVLLDLLASTQTSSRVDKLKEEISQLQSRLMILEKVVEQADNDERENYHMLVEDFNNLRQENERLEKQLHKFYEKIGEVDYLSGLVTKHIEIVSPTEQALSFKKEHEQLVDFISMQKDQINRLTEEKNKLIRINTLMKEEVEIKKEDIRNMTMIFNSPEAMMNLSVAHNNGENTEVGGNFLDELDEKDQDNRKGGAFELSPLNNSALVPSNPNTSFNSVLNMSTAKGLNTTLNNFIKMQKRVIREEDEDDCGSNESVEMEDCAELNILFPDKVEQIKKNRETTKVPYLNMVKIRDMMAKREKKIRKEVEADNKRINPTDKIIKLETELDITRKQLASQSLKFRNTEEEYQLAMRVNQELEQRNQLLLEANERLSCNYQNVYKDYQLTKVIALRVERAMKHEANYEKSMAELNCSKDYEDKLNAVESMIKRVFGPRAFPSRSQSVDVRGNASLRSF